jgi:hypothetical protein
MKLLKNVKPAFTALDRDIILAAVELPLSSGTTRMLMQRACLKLKHPKLAKPVWFVSPTNRSRLSAHA